MITQSFGATHLCFCLFVNEPVKKLSQKGKSQGYQNLQEVIRVSKFAERTVRNGFS